MHDPETCDILLENQIKYIQQCNQTIPCSHATENMEDGSEILLDCPKNIVSGSVPSLFIEDRRFKELLGSLKTGAGRKGSCQANVSFEF